MQLEKAIAQQQAQREKKSAAAERAAEKGTQAAKNQAVRAREALQAADAKVKDLRDQIKVAMEALANAREPQKKYAAEEKVLAKFEKDWAKATAAKPKRRAKRRTRKPAAAPVEAPVNEAEAAPASVAEEKSS